MLRTIGRRDKLILKINDICDDEQNELKSRKPRKKTKIFAKNHFYDRKSKKLS